MNTEKLLEIFIKWVRENLSPEDMFSDAQLDDWATHNGYKKENENGE